MGAWIQVDLGKVMKLSKVGTMGLKGENKRVTSYSLSYSNTGESWNVFKENGKKKVSILLFTQWRLGLIAAIIPVPHAP